GSEGTRTQEHAARPHGSRVPVGTFARTGRRALHRTLAAGTLRAIFRQACRYVPSEIPPGSSAESETVGRCSAPLPAVSAARVGRVVDPEPREVRPGGAAVSREQRIGPEARLRGDQDSGGTR